MHWTRGYVADIGYTAHFYPEMAPAHLALCALLTGRSPGRALRPRTVLELGCGQGFGLAVLAAANPHINFEGQDFNPEHVAHARRLAEAAELANLTVTETSFEEAAGRGGPNDVDVISLHGVLTWIRPESRDAITAIIRQRLQPDGLVYASYNCQPGWAPLIPLRHLFTEVRRRQAGRSDRQIAQVLDLLTKLKNGGAAYFANNGPVISHVDLLLKHDYTYLAHEYFAADWTIFPFSEIVDLFDNGKLSYVCSASIPENLDQYAIPQSLLPLVNETQDPVLRELLRDFASGKRFRRDIFARGLTPLTATEHRSILSEMRFGSTTPRDKFAFQFKGPLGSLTGMDEFYAPLADRLAAGEASFDELASLPPFKDQPIGTLLDCLGLLAHSQQIFPILPARPVDPAPAQRFNRMIAERVRTGRVYSSLAAPVIGTGIGVNDFDLLALSAIVDGVGEEVGAAARHALEIFKDLGRRPVQDGVPIEDDGRALDFLHEQLTPVFDRKLPIWRRLGIL